MAPHLFAHSRDRWFWPLASLQSANDNSLVAAANVAENFLSCAVGYDSSVTPAKVNVCLFGQQGPLSGGMVWEFFFSLRPLSVRSLSGTPSQLYDFYRLLSSVIWLKITDLRLSVVSPFQLNLWGWQQSASLVTSMTKLVIYQWSINYIDCQNKCQTHSPQYYFF